MDLRNQDSVNNLKIIVGPTSSPQVNNTVVKVLSRVNESLQPSMSLPSASFKSNIATNKPPISSLLPSQSTNLLGNKPMQTPKNLLVQKPINKINQPAALPKPVDTAMKYDQTYATSVNSRLVNTEVTGKIKSKPGDLLHSH